MDRPPQLQPCKPQVSEQHKLWQPDRVEFNPGVGSTQGHSLQATLLPLGGLPAKDASKAARPACCTPSALHLGPRQQGPAGAPTPARPLRRPAPLAARPPGGSFASQSPGVSSNVPFLPQDTQCPPPAPGAAGGPGPRSLPIPYPAPGCPPGAPVPGRSPQGAATSQVFPAPPRSRADTV